MNARYYAPELRRFISADTIVPEPGNPMAFNRYAYTYQNPINLIDPTGHYYVEDDGVACPQHDVKCHDSIDPEIAAYRQRHGCAAGVTICADPSSGGYIPNSVDDAAAQEALGYIKAGYTGITILAGFVGADAIFDGAEFLYCAGTGNAACAALASAGFWMPGVSAAVFRHVPGSNTIARYADEAVGIFCSFSEETLVSTEDGLVPISDVDAGEYVLAYDEATEEIGYYPVTAVWVHTDPVIVELTIDGETIETTLEHPFYTDEGTWIPADELQIGDEIRDAEWGTGTVDDIHVTYQPQPMYNFTVAEAHTYFVGDEQWLVHNSCGAVLGPRGVYENVAAAHGARSFQLPDSVWNAMNRTERWAANKAFLNDLITDNAQIRILVPENLYNNMADWLAIPSTVRNIPNYYLREEIRYLTITRSYSNIVWEVIP